uniref:Uncharacterized protein n=1 Tax=Panagrolaimus sp. PS1159 TaxID=55785 RepID=A0AC35FU09_9BILA
MYPGKYLRLDSRYAHALVWCTMALTIPILIAATITANAVGDSQMQLKTCVLNTTTEIFMLNTAIRILSNIGGCLLYFPICQRIYHVIF